MTRRFIVRRKAEADLAAAKAWYDGQREGLGEEFLLCIEEAFDRVRRLPEVSREVFPRVRRVLVRRFPYGVFYKVGSDHLSVIAVYHNRRDPRGWQARA